MQDDQMAASADRASAGAGAGRARDDDGAMVPQTVPADAGVWIEPVPEPESSRRPQRLRRLVVLPRAVASARVRIASRGDCALFVNDHRLDGEGPSLSAAGEPVRREYEAAPYLVPGENVVAVILGESWGSATPVPGRRPFAHPSPPLAVVLDLELVDDRGVRTLIGSDETFRATTGAIIYSEPGRGERQEHALRDPGWKLPGFDDSGWRPARRSTDADRGVLDAPADADAGTARPDAASAVRVVGEVPAVSVEPLGDAVLVDFGRRLVGRVRVGFTAPSGTEVTLEHLTEHPDARGRGPVGVDVFVSAGDVHEVFEPGYAFHDFRWVRVSGLPHAETARFTVLELSLPPGVG
ncbi:MAG: family 78 glycoside hydrolase catalytic domain [Herbiconiux sp.]|nr:family 78 glycoside hydrolase catalytic domain [Herbiconiux sp.]